jgi:hypothetical protein
MRMTALLLSSADSRAEVDTEANMTMKHMRVISLLCLALCVAKAYGSAAENDPVVAADAGRTKQEGKKVDVLKVMREYLARFADGSDYESDKFETVLTHEQSEGLRALGVCRIVNKGNHYTVTFDKQRNKKLRHAEIRYGPAVIFDYAEVNGVVTITNIQGVQGKVTFVLGFMDAKSLAVKTDPATGNTTITVVVHAWVGDLSHSVLLGPDGKTIKHD